MGYRLLAGSLAATALAVLLGSTPAPAADEKQQCVDGYEQSQRLRRDGKLRAAHEQLVVCSNRACPEAAQLDCARWLAEVELAQPSVVVSAKGPVGGEWTEVRVLVDGELAAGRLDGRAIGVDPGLRKIRVESADGRALERSILVREGEKFRMVEFTFSRERVGPPAAAPPNPAAERPAGERSAWPPLASYVLGGVGVAAIALGTYLDVTGKDQETKLKNTCAPGCAPADVDAMRTRVLAGDITLGAGIASLASALVVALAAPRAGGPSAWLSASPVAAGAVVGAGGRF